MDDDVEKVLSEIRARGEKLLDGFEDILHSDADKIVPHLEELKRRQDDVLLIVENTKKKK